MDVRRAVFFARLTLALPSFISDCGLCGAVKAARSAASVRRCASLALYCEGFSLAITDPLETGEDVDVPLYHELDNQGDRAAAVIAAGFVDRSLQLAMEAEWGITSNTVRDRLFAGSKGALSSFSAKIEVGFAMSLFGPKTRGDLNLVRQIRNKFAHELRAITFSSAEIIALCDKLELSKSTPVPQGADPRRYRYVRLCKVVTWVFAVWNEELSKPSRDKSAPRPPLPTLP